MSSDAVEEFRGTMEFLQPFREDLRHALEAVVLEARGTLESEEYGSRARAAGGAVCAARMYCEAASVVCRFVEEGKIRYSELSAVLESLRAGIVRFIHAEIGLEAWVLDDDSCRLSVFERLAKEELEWSAEWRPQWRAIEQKRVGLARHHPENVKRSAWAAIALVEEEET